MPRHIDDLRDALLKLPATGPEGFEGLLSVTLTEISGVPFRLASNGSQFGIDGKATYEDDAVCFEGKRYDNRIPRSEVLTKIAELSIRDNGEIDLWVLGATTPVGTQLADDIRELGQKSGIATLILDWSNDDLPPLAVALAMAEPTASAFLKKHAKGNRSATKALAALKEIQDDGGLPSHAVRIRTLLQEPTTGTGLAKEANDHWLTEVFSSKVKAKRYLRQPLAPGDTALGEPEVRHALVDAMKLLMTSRPDGKIAAVLGDDGNGKSWLVAQSWLSLKEQPLMVVFTADDFGDTSAPGDLTDMLIDKLIAQTGGRRSEAACNRWRRKLDRWRGCRTPDTPRLVVVIDGLNQRRQTDWARIIEAMSFEIDRIGGRLIITARTRYYAGQVRRRMVAAVVEVNVPEWTDVERDAILAARNILGAGLRPQVATSLRNPRLLGIALELLQSAQIEELEELSVSRLLFEHMRVYERDASSPRPANEFARTLQDHARKILDRVGAQKRDDLKVFDVGLEAVSDGLFFIPVEGDSTRYSLGEDGLTLALGFAVLDDLRAARRNARDLPDALEAMIEPISALDRTAEAVMAALTIACLDDDCPTDVGAAVVVGFAELQNPNADEFPAFAALTHKRPDIFMRAAHRMCLASARQANFDWIEAALHAAKKHDTAWSAMSPYLQSWLGHYSLSPEVRMFPTSNPVEEIEKERTERQNEIDTKLAAFSDLEKELLDTLVRNDNGDLVTLGRLALQLMAGKPIAPFATALASWSFANALNGAFQAPYTEFMHLIRLNRTDWRETRMALLKTCGMFEGADVSRTGKWALANLLQATGDPDDAAKANTVVDILTDGRERSGGWRLVEKYCAVDPFDPNSEKPENVARTAEDYAAIDVSKIRVTMGYSGEDHFFEMARGGIARFEPQVGIDKHREFIADVMERNYLPLRQGVFETYHHKSLVRHDDAVRLAGRITSGAIDGLTKKERWIVSQNVLRVAFPLLSASEQIETLLSAHAGEDILVQLLEVAKPLEEATFEALLEKAIHDNDERAQFALLAFARCTATQVSRHTRRHLPELVRSPVERIRAQALALVATIGDVPAIKAVVDSGWSAARVTREDGHEGWYGSCVILEAAERGMIMHDEALSRITPELYGRAARGLGSDAAGDVARRVDASIRTATDLVLDIAVPEIELARQGNGGVDPPRYSISEKSNDSIDPKEALRQLSESNEAFEERQRRIQAAFEAFKAELTKAKAGIILDRLQIADFDAIVAAAPNLAESWFDLFMGLPTPRRAAVHNLGLLLAHALAGSNPRKAVRLFAALADSEPFVRWTFGRAGVELDAMTIWSAKDHPLLDSVRFDRLDKAGSDHDLAMEVLGALANGKKASLRGYIDARLQTGQPAEIARALMVAGFSDHNEFNDSVLARYQGTPGFIGQAQSAAMYAYERNVWSEHWSKKMREAEKPEEFWRYSVLLTKIVDGRFDSLRTGDSDNGKPYRMFWPSSEDRLKHRYDKWRAERKKKLFGQDAPRKAFLFPA